MRYLDTNLAATCLSIIVKKSAVNRELMLEMARRLEKLLPKCAIQLKVRLMSNALVKFTVCDLLPPTIRFDSIRKYGQLHYG